ncbi:hypothetical protein DND62_30610, partial [Pseudomonas syringae pv. pisi]
DLECAEFLSKLYAEVSRMSTSSEEALTAKKGFLEACKAELEHRNSRLEAPVPLLSYAIRKISTRRSLANSGVSTKLKNIIIF